MRYLRVARNIIFTPGICWFAYCRSFNQHSRFQQIWVPDQYQVCNEALSDAAYITVTPELHHVRFLPWCQAHFNLNGKLGRKTLAFL